ncbi:MAG: UDP-N-acetylglucosamine 1-carboxyvinyltransferase [Clostridia bacterium]|nr:UDP-N-acetylglucosamine 1-carboxyvinyltransferase [Clostridia bacterium]
MAKFVINGGKKLSGVVKVSGAKNAAVAIMAAAVMADGETILENVPCIADVQVMLEIIESLGAAGKWLEPNTLFIKSGAGLQAVAPYPLAKKLRASNLLLGALLGKLGRAEVSLPGGCQIGSRPMDLHLKGLHALGADISLEHGYIKARGKLRGNKVYLDFPSVGATENIMMAASLAEGQTIIENAAKEPEIVDLASFLNGMGAKVRGAGTDLIRIQGVKELRPVRYSIIPDRIEAGTFMIGAAMSAGKVRLENVISTHLQPLIAKLKEVGAKIEQAEDVLIVEGPARALATDLKTLPYPGFPTDLQSPMLALLTRARGTSVVVETIYENRLRVAEELKRMGANVKVEGQTAVVVGVEKLYGAQTKAYDLRAGAALVLAGVVAEGQSEVWGVDHIERGYEDFPGKLNSLGAEITVIDH